MKYQKLIMSNQQKEIENAIELCQKIQLKAKDISSDFSIEDNIWVFQDLAEKNYGSIFENKYPLTSNLIASLYSIPLLIK